MESEKRKKILNTVGYWTILNIGIIILAVGVYFFKSPNNFATGGVSGLSIIISPLFEKMLPSVAPTQIKMGINFVINFLLLVIGFIFLGRGCTFKTAYCSLVYSLEAYLLSYIPVPLPLTNQTFLEFVIAMLTTGLGSAILFNCGASSGGTDIIALIIKKFTKIKNIGVALIIADVIIAFSTFFVYGRISGLEVGIRTGLYSMLGLFVKSFLVDGMIESIGKNTSLTIITSNPELVAPFILEKMHRSFTQYKARGGYSHDPKTIMLTVCRRGEGMRLKAKILQADPTSFVIMTDTNEIIGKGFRNNV